MSAFFAALGAWLNSLFSTPKKAAGTAGAAAILAATAAFVGPWEGERTEAYLDRIAKPPVWTVCYGETRGVKPGDRYTSAQCNEMLMDALADYRAPLIACIPALPSQPEGVQVALISWAYNVGTGAACGSTLAKRANAGDWPGACNQLPRWNKAGGKAIQGLTNRRAAEQKLCLNALKGA
ncbi:lysozyme [Paracoccus sulfuroxidans]|uniref:Lysozyme n=1 Tax=Paracoccus sulfuroxidans TaxID=384678 RepID=A0A562NQ26_9RHOB|nr:lysozyme [Paracoccus sulfuroxidans]AZV00353.1 lysozyme [Paracoccus phage vB_PsuS_Psul1]TWI34294.1 lysozyme [Paracoccus sulfuroxidans]